MFQLAVAASLLNQIPTFGAQHRQHIAYFWWHDKIRRGWTDLAEIAALEELVVELTPKEEEASGPTQDCGFVTCFTPGYLLEASTFLGTSRIAGASNFAMASPMASGDTSYISASSALASDLLRPWPLTRQAK